MANYFSPIDWNSPDAQAEYDKRNAMNAQIDFINQLGQASGGNRQLQNALLGQYLGMVFPEDTSAQDSESQLGIAMDLIASGDPGLTETGRAMLTKNPLLSQYFQSDETTQPDAQQSLLNDAFYNRAQSDFAVDANSPKNANMNAQILSMIERDPSLAAQYYTNEPSIGQWAGQAVGGIRDIPWYANLAPIGSAIGGAGALLNAGDRARRKNIFGL